MKKIIIKFFTVMAVVLPLMMWALPSVAQTTVTVGNDPAARTQQDTFIGDFIFVDANNTVSFSDGVSESGWLTSFTYYAKNENPFYFFLIDYNDVVRWVSAKITPPGIGVNSYTPTSPVPVELGWYLGIYNIFDPTATTPLTSAIPYEDRNGDENYPTNYYSYTGAGDPQALVGQMLILTDSLYRTYSFGATGTTVITPPATVKVSVAKYLSTGEHAKAITVNGASFTVNASWSGPNAGQGAIVLGPNNEIPYEATSVEMTAPASFSLSEDTGASSLVGSVCGNGKTFQLVGYSVGTSLADAVQYEPITTTPPSLTGLSSDVTIVVWNRVCGQSDVRAGNDTLERFNLDPYGDFTVLDTNKPVSNNGWLTKFHYYASNLSPFRFFVVDEADVVQWVSDEIIPPAQGDNTFFPSPVAVVQGWYVGVYFVNAGTIPYEDGGEPAFYKVTGSGSPLLFLGRTLQHYSGEANRTYSYWAEGETILTPPENITVSVIKYVDGNRADAATLKNAEFPMNEDWSAANIAAGSASFVLGPIGIRTTNSYESRTVPMKSGAYYSVSENTGTNVVGKNCNQGQLYSLAGYTTGDTLLQAVTATPTTTAPRLSNILYDKYVIVWNTTCPPPPDDECDDDDNGHHYGNDKGDNHSNPNDKCKKDNGHHYGNDKGDNHQSKGNGKK